MASCKIKKSDYPYVNHEEAAKFCHTLDMRCVEKKAPRLNKRNIELQQQKLKKLEKQMREQLGPGWFQELSENQIAAANLLFTAVGNDGVHCQLKRVIPILNKINIHPLPTYTQLVDALKFARNSDLAFLWFLYDHVYRTDSDVCTQTSYSLNERLILSCICHLDMMLTLRELEKILPKEKKLREKKKLKKVQKVEKVYKNPYEEPLPKPKMPDFEKIKKPTRTQPKFEIYNLYKNPYYIIENEVNRWFASSSLMFTQTECIIQKIITDLIDDSVKKENKNTRKSLCKRHHEESSKFYQMMKRILNENENFDNETLLHLNGFERGIVEGIQLELATAEKNFIEAEEFKQSKIIVKTILSQILENAADLKFIHLCEQCEECVRGKDLFDQLVQEKQEEVNVSKTSVDSSSSIIVQYCQRTSPFGPLTFDYEKIFATSFLQDQGAVRNSINTALELEKHLTEDNAITVCLRDMWRLEMRLWNEKRQAEIVDRQQQVVAESGEVWGNRKKILKLLEDAIEILRRNPKFVLAALPDSHRLPMLREWILQRYGIKHTDEEERRKFKINKNQRDILLNAGVVPRLEVPDFKYFGIKKPLMTVEETTKKTKAREKWVKKYESELASGCVDRCRMIYATMEPYLCNFETMRSIFYAYLPGNHQQVDLQTMNADIF